MYVIPVRLTIIIIRGYVLIIITHSNSNSGTSGGQRSLARGDEIRPGWPQAVIIGYVWRRKVIHLIIQDDSSVSHQIGTKVGIYSPTSEIKICKNKNR